MRNSTMNRMSNTLNQVGYLEIIMGPMFCGKTTSLLRNLTMFADMKVPTLYINHSIDNRSDQDFSTHNPLIKTLGNINSTKAMSLGSVSEDLIREAQVIGIDESQFFPDLVEMVLKWVDEDNKHVFVAGLSGDALKNNFGSIYQLIPHADEITKLCSFCQVCKNERNILTVASFTKKLVHTDVQIEVGGRDMYLPVCRSCYKL